MTSGDTAYHKLSKSKVEAISAEIALKHSISKLAKMTILDVGGYDGWILVQLQQEPKFNLAMCKLPKMNLVMSLL